jgi:hypothetical protein
MKLGAQVMKVLSKVYEPDAIVIKQVGRQDLAIRADGKGRAVLLFIGRADPQGRIRGERFSSQLQTDEAGNVVKDHWDNKGKTS